MQLTKLEIQKLGKEICLEIKGELKSKGFLNPAEFETTQTFYNKYKTTYTTKIVWLDNLPISSHDAEIKSIVSGVLSKHPEIEPETQIGETRYKSWLAYSIFLKYKY